jgi:hypothetical protein
MNRMKAAVIDLKQTFEISTKWWSSTVSFSPTILTFRSPWLRTLLRKKMVTRSSYRNKVLHSAISTTNHPAQPLALLQLRASVTVLEISARINNLRHWLPLQSTQIKMVFTLHQIPPLARIDTKLLTFSYGSNVMTMSEKGHLQGSSACSMRSVAAKVSRPATPKQRSTVGTPN